MIPDNTSELMFPRENGFGDEEQTREEVEWLQDSSRGVTPPLILSLFEERLSLHLSLPSAAARVRDREVHVQGVHGEWGELP